MQAPFIIIVGCLLLPVSLMIFCLFWWQFYLVARNQTSIEHSELRCAPLDLDVCMCVHFTSMRSVTVLIFAQSRLSAA